MNLFDIKQITYQK